MEPDVQGVKCLFHGSNELRQRVFFARYQNLGIISVLYHVRVRGKEGEVVGEDEEEERAQGGSLEYTDRIGQGFGEV